jgi:hypothetical protein
MEFVDLNVPEKWACSYAAETTAATAFIPKRVKAANYG